MRRRHRPAGAIALVLLALSHSEPAEAQVEVNPTREAASAEPVDFDWELSPLGEDPVPLADFRGRVLFVNAWASWCTPCVREMASIERLAERLSGTDVAFLLVAVERERSVRRHLRRHPSALPIFLEEERFPPGFGLRGIPTTWIVDREGRIAFRHFGAAEWDRPEVEAFVRELVQEQAPGR